MKKKSIVLSVILALIFCLSSVALFGCSKKTSIKSTYFMFKEVMSYIKDDDDTTLISNTQYNQSFSDDVSLETQYCLNNFGFVESDENKSLTTADYIYYSYFVGYGLNFIEKYYPALENVKIKMDYNSLYNSIKDVKADYDELKESHSNLLDYNNVSFVIYNGSFYNYRKDASAFIDSVFKCANSLGDFLNNKVKLGANIGNDKMTEEAWAFYYDFNLLHTIEDYKYLFMTSYKGISFYSGRKENETFKTILTNFNNYVKDKKFGPSVATAEQAKQFKELFGHVDATRKNVRSSCKSFSMYDFTNKYASDLVAYKKDIM